MPHSALQQRSRRSRLELCAQAGGAPAEPEQGLYGFHADRRPQRFTPFVAKASVDKVNKIMQERTLQRKGPIVDNAKVHRLATSDQHHPRALKQRLMLRN